MSEETLQLRGKLSGHCGWVTAVATSYESSDTIVTSSRDKNLIVWKLKDTNNDALEYTHTTLTGHTEAVQDVSLSADGLFAVSASWDATLRLWDLSKNKCNTVFEGHTGDVISVTFSADNRMVVSSSADKTIKLWNCLGVCKHTIEGNQQHTDVIPCVRASPNTENPLVVSAGWDGLAKVWSLDTASLRTNLEGHTGAVTCLTISPDGSLCVTGGRDGVAMLWDLGEGRLLYSLGESEEGVAASAVTAVCFSPSRYWVCVGTESSIKVYDLESKEVIQELLPTSDRSEDFNKDCPWCTCLTWSADGRTLFAGSSDGNIYAYALSQE